MRILFTFIGGSGHFRPLIPFARAAKAAGHTVAVAGSGNRYDEVTAAGFTALRTSEAKPKSESADEAEETPQPVDLSREEQVMRDGFAGRGARRHAKAVREIALEWKPDVIVRDEIDFGSAIAAETLRIPCANVVVLLAGGLARKEVILDPITELRAEYGLVPDPELTRLAGGLTIMPAPPSLRDPRHPLPTDTFWCAPGDHVQRRARSAAQPLIYLTFGTLDTYRSVFERMLTGLRDLPVRVVATVGRRLDPASFGAQPQNVHIAQFIPQEKTFAAAELVIAHGGSGTLIGSLAHGIPSVLLPMGADQPYNAKRCVELGTALELDPVTFTPEDAARTVAAMLHEDSYRLAAQRIQEEINTLPEPAQALGLIEALA